MLINIGHSIYLPGINEESFDFDGSRVYFGVNISIDTNNVEFSGYQTVNFKDEKISGIWKLADYGGVNNQLNQINQLN
jgi:predicted ester cyclase